ncbi:uncharacterized protein lrfn4b isoform X1, partial [Tachysurus ichikawai]
SPSPRSVDLVGVPEDYRDIQVVFSKQRAQALLPHCTFKCAINLVQECQTRCPLPPVWVWGAFCRPIGATARLSSSFHPVSNDQPERVNQDLIRSLHCLASSKLATWVRHLVLPFECQFGYIYID